MIYHLFIFRPPETTGDGASENTVSGTSYNIEFSFDTDVRCAVTIKYFCTEEITANGVM